MRKGELISVIQLAARRIPAAPLRDVRDPEPRTDHTKPVPPPAMGTHQADIRMKAVMGIVLLRMLVISSSRMSSRVELPWRGSWESGMTAMSPTRCHSPRKMTAGARQQWQIATTLGRDDQGHGSPKAAGNLHHRLHLHIALACTSLLSPFVPFVNRYFSLEDLFNFLPTPRLPSLMCRFRG